MKTGKSPKNHKRNIIWFDPRFPNNVSDNIGKYFLLLIQQHFPNNHEYHTTKIMRNIQLNYSCMANIKSVINMHNKEVIMKKKTEAV